MPDLAFDLFAEAGLLLRPARAGIEHEEDAVAEVREDISPRRHDIRHRVGHIADEVEIGGRSAPAVDRVNVGDLEGGEFRALCAAFPEAFHQVLERVVVQVAGHVVDIERVADIDHGRVHQVIGQRVHALGQGGALAGLLADQRRRVQARLEIHDVERLGDVVGRAGSQRPVDILAIGHGGKHDDRRRPVFRHGADGGTQLEPVDIGHLDIDQEAFEGRGRRLNLVERVLTVARGGHGFETEDLKRNACKFPDASVIIHDENAHVVQHYSTPLILRFYLL